MSTTLGPLVNGLRIQFKVDFDLADVANITEVIIRDTLPNGISLYQGTPNNNKMTYTVGAAETTLTPVTDYNIIFGGSEVSFTMTAAGIAKLTGAGTLAAFIDTVISNAEVIDSDAGVTNSASAQFTQNGTLNQGEISEVINIEGSEIVYISPDYAPKDQTQQIPITLKFNAGSSTDTSLNYIVTTDLGSNLVLDPAEANPITGMYQDESGVSVPVNLTFTNSGSVYTITIPNAANLANKEITLLIKTKPNYGASAPQTIDFKYKLTVGQANADFITKQIIVSSTFVLRKSVITI